MRVKPHHLIKNTSNNEIYVQTTYPSHVSFFASWMAKQLQQQTIKRMCCVPGSDLALASAWISRRARRDRGHAQIRNFEKSHRELWLFNNYYFFGCAASSLLCRLFSSCREWGPLFSCGEEASQCGGFSLLWSAGSRMHRLPCLQCGLDSCGTQALEHRLESCGACA